MIIFKLNGKILPEINYLFDLTTQLNDRTKTSKLYRKNKIWENSDIFIEYIDDENVDDCSSNDLNNSIVGNTFSDYYTDSTDYYWINNSKYTSNISKYTSNYYSNNILYGISGLFQKLPIRSIILKNFIHSRIDKKYLDLFSDCKKLQSIKFLDANDNEVNFIDLINNEILEDNTARNSHWQLQGYTFINMIKNNLNLKYFSLGNCEIDNNKLIIKKIIEELFLFLK